MNIKHKRIHRTEPYQVTRRLSRVHTRHGPKPLEHMPFLQAASRTGLNEMPLLVIDNIITHLDIEDIASLAEAEVSEHFNEYVYLACKREFENKIKPEIQKMINKSGITGIKMPKGTWNNSIHQMRALIAFRDDLPNAINVLKKKKIKDINAKDYYEKTPLHWAAINGQTDIAQALIDAGADLNAQDNNEETPLHWAARNGHTETLQALIDAGAEVNAPNISGVTPLMWAAINGQTDIVKALLEFGANVNVKDKCGWTPLIWAKTTGQTEVEKILRAAQITQSA